MRVIALFGKQTERQKSRAQKPFDNPVLSHMACTVLSSRVSCFEQYRSENSQSKSNIITFGRIFQTIRTQPARCLTIVKKIARKLLNILPSTIDHVLLSSKHIDVIRKTPVIEITQYSNPTTSKSSWLFYSPKTKHRFSVIKLVYEISHKRNGRFKKYFFHNLRSFLTTKLLQCYLIVLLVRCGPS